MGKRISFFIGLVAELFNLQHHKSNVVVIRPTLRPVVYMIDKRVDNLLRLFIGMLTQKTGNCIISNNIFRLFQGYFQR